MTTYKQFADAPDPAKILETVFVKNIIIIIDNVTKENFSFFLFIYLVREGKGRTIRSLGE